MRKFVVSACCALAGLLVSACSGGAGSGAEPAVGGAAAGTGASAGASAGTGGNGGAAAVVDLSPHHYDADDPNLQLTGRVDWTDPKRPRFSAAGTYLRARFVGTSVTLLLDDETRWGTEQNYYEVVIDDQPPFKLAAAAEQTSFVLAENLPATEHTLTVAKRTEANIGYSEFLGLDVTGELVAPPARPERRIEFIGDSITCGSGNEAESGSAQCEEGGWGQPYHNNHASYGPVLARSLDAEYHVTAVSGIGLVRNYSNMYDARPMPEVYGLTFVELTTSPAWDTSQFVPDALVVALGTNDFSPGDSERPKMDRATFTDAYVAFVEELRGHYPDAHVFAVSSPMLGDGWPDAADTFLTDQRESLADVAAHFAAEGDGKVHAFTATKLIGEGCGTHPSAAQHATMAAELGAFMQETMGW